MTKSDLIRAYALGQVGGPYVYGATAKKCTPGYRQARQKQYPAFAASIAKYCPVLSGEQPGCTGCKYFGRLAHDCAQLTRYAAVAAGLTLPSGSKSQYTRGDWAAGGPIDALPEGQVAFLYRVKSDGSIPHTGIALGDGTAVDARGHSNGVLHSKLDSYPWTHYKILRGQEMDSAVPLPMEPPTVRLLQYMSGEACQRGEDVKLVQGRLVELGHSVGIKGIDGVYGPDTEAAVKAFQSVSRLKADGVVNAATRAALAGAAPAALYRVTIPALTATQRDALLKQYPGSVVETEVQP